MLFEVFAGTPVGNTGPLGSAVTLNAARTLPEQIHQDIATSPTPKQENPSPLLQTCPDEWIEDDMPAPLPGSPPPFIYNNDRHELSEFDLDWIKAHCNLSIQHVH
jgi:hypothetical protein